ncbi:unnamed protein product [Rhizophagus irregularis]|uniref:MATA-HMG n=3 Tax=Rhizophagus irregularis TaxID=588596 RepID=A0A1B1ETW5_9GLOM|nr:MATA-HMG [Rhizophagus irregularis]CAB4391718.1 unnamed protein product [Rhizophagus irregularis]CAB5383135.1 unnamed protein product [Rhizophagus irregularis]
MPKSKSTYMSSGMSNYLPSQFMTTNSNNIVSDYDTDLYQIFISLLTSEIPYKLTLPFDELLIPKIKSEGKIPRPLNSWLIFLKDFTAKIKTESNVKLCIKDISSMASKSWSNQPPQVKQFFEILGVSAKQVHTLIFPGYKFRPERKYKLRFDNIRSNTAPRSDLSSQLPLKGDSSLMNEICQPNSFSLGDDFPSSPSYDLFSLDDIYNSLSQNSNTMNESSISLKEFYELTESELNNTKHY